MASQNRRYATIYYKLIPLLALAIALEGTLFPSPIGPQNDIGFIVAFLWATFVLFRSRLNTLWKLITLLAMLLAICLEVRVLLVTTNLIFIVK